ncbi:hypothetical protein [Dysgonomonas massiliensis]|uniref:hypothetical protein n=1 Tax=Dysgonomonas massiliensis TaxID=2040292 RepID=UPI000C75EBBC|nr:hypothetical protein [Dysgonomonas massiliensis]
MGIKMTGNGRKVIKDAAKQAERDVERVILRTLNAVGMHCIGFARDNGYYTDRTGNLRSSVGYIIAKDGKEFSKYGFDPNENNAKPPKKDGEKGANDGYKFAVSLLNQYSKGYVLIFVAGMFYAEYVEKAGYDVLIGTQIEAEDVAKKMFDDLTSKFKSK